MMSNLFSIFDPSTPNFLSSNWISLLIWSMIFPLSFWLISNRFKSIFFMITSYVFSEFKPLIKKSPFVLILPLSFFCFILLNNSPGLLPYIFTATSHMVCSLPMALSMWIGIILYGVLNNTSNMLIHLIPQGTPGVLAPFMVLIETTSNVIRPMTLAIRLSANMIAGHLLISLLMSASMIAPFWVGPVLGSAQMALAGLEVAVAFIQAYVFSVLVTLYATEVL